MILKFHICLIPQYWLSRKKSAHPKQRWTSLAKTLVLHNSTCVGKKSALHYLLPYTCLGAASKLNQRLTSGSVRFQVVAIVKNNSNCVEPDETADHLAVGFEAVPYLGSGWKTVQASTNPSVFMPCNSISPFKNLKSQIKQRVTWVALRNRYFH